MSDPTRALRDAAGKVCRLNTSGFGGHVLSDAVNALRDALAAFDAAQPCPSTCAPRGEPPMRCVLREGHDGSHGDGKGGFWTDIIPRRTEGSVVDEHPANRLARAAAAGPAALTAERERLRVDAPAAVIDAVRYDLSGPERRMIEVDEERLESALAALRARLSLLDGTHPRYRVYYYGGRWFVDSWKRRADGAGWERVGTSYAKCDAAIAALLAVDPEAMS